MTAWCNWAREEEPPRTGWPLWFYVTPASYRLALAMINRAVPALSRYLLETAQEEVPAQGRDSKGMSFNQCKSV